MFEIWGKTLSTEEHDWMLLAQKIKFFKKKSRLKINLNLVLLVNFTLALKIREKNFQFENTITTNFDSHDFSIKSLKNL